MGRKLESFSKFAVLSMCLLFLIYYTVTHTGRDRAIAGIGDPIQTEASGGVEKQVGDYHVKIQFLYAYDITALVLHAKDYRGKDVGCQLSNKDVALGWGVVAQKNLDVDFHWNQANRAYTWRLNSGAELQKVGSIEEISLHSANTHLIPADDTITRQAKRLKKGDYVRIRGYLVNVDGESPDGSTFWWYSSTTREDTGDHSCEVVYVTSIEMLDI